MIDGVVAIVGRPNVGKSTIFNRIIGERLSIVEDSPGVTRDRIYSKANWLTKDFRIIDTGGIQLENATFQEEIRVQVEIAIDEADVIVFIVNGKEGITDDDRYIELHVMLLIVYLDMKVMIMSLLIQLEFVKKVKFMRILKNMLF